MSALDELLGDGYEDVDVGEGYAPFFEVGTFYLKVSKMKVGESEQKGFPFFVAEFEVVASNNPDFPPTSHVQYMVAKKEKRYAEMYARNIKNCLWGVISGFDPSPEAKESAGEKKTLVAAVSEAQPFTGKPVKAVAQKNKNGFIVPVFSAWDGELPAEALPWVN